MTQSGLAVFIGLNSTSIDRLVERYSNPHKDIPETLEALRSKGLAIRSVPNGTGGKPVGFIPAELCEAIIWHYMTEAKQVSDEVRAKARYSYRKFATVGIKAWILQVTGFKSNEGQDIAGMLQTIMTQMSEMKQLTAGFSICA